MAFLWKKYSSTVFLCDTNDDDRYVRCDFKHCKEHPLVAQNNAKIPVSYWSLNTTNNCQLLERHVTKEIHLFVRMHEPEVSQLAPHEYELNLDLLHDSEKLRSYKKVLIVFNLRNPQSSYGRWLDKFLEAANNQQVSEDFVCLTLSFASRFEMLEKIERLNDLNWNPSCEVMVVLSCHSSSQGQVFSCTPTVMSKLYGFEEFSSIHDFVCSLQDILKDNLKIVHVSSCFAMKLDRSHMDWPVESCWIRNKLKCLLSGSAKEVYETGSQTADLYIILKTFLAIESSIKMSFRHAIKEISLDLFPDLVLEMGLCVVEPDLIEAMIENEENEDQVTVQTTVVSSLHLIVVCDSTNPSTLLLKDALMCNLKTRFQLDFVTAFSVIESGLEMFAESLPCLQNAQNIFIVVLQQMDDVDFLKENVARIACQLQERKLNLYGIHFNCVNVDPIFNEQFKQDHGNTYSQSNVGMFDGLGVDVTAVFMDPQRSTVLYSDTFPLLLYVVHLSLGENGEKRTQSNGVVTLSSWSLHEVYKEACHVLEGLCRKCKFKIISMKTSDSDNISNSSTIQCTSTTDTVDDTTKNTPTEEIERDCSATNDGALDFPNILDKQLKDVPLMANVDEVHIYHYALNLDVDFNEKCVTGCEILFLKPANETVAAKEFQMCLDCTLIDVLSVEEIVLPGDFRIHFHHEECCCKSSTDKNQQPAQNETESDRFCCASCSFLQTYEKSNTKDLNYKTLPYAVYGWCIRVWNLETSKHHWPRCVGIRYKTKAIGPSLTWCKDQDGNDCCYTPGAFINNRSMMPCQEPPVAMATWQATIHLPENFVAISSGNLVECKQRIFSGQSNKETYCFEMTTPLPSSTLAFAFGKFSKSSKSIPALMLEDCRQIPVTLFASESKIREFEEEYLELTVDYLQICCQLLGSYPFTRLDLVIMPRSFACMGLKSPNLVFLSQSVACGDCSMSTRIAHEITHGWFGLLVGAKDWTEEWLSEGFATYMEDRIVAHHKKMSDTEFCNYSGLLQLLRLNVLKGELTQTEDDNLKLLRPKRKGNYTTAVEAVKNNIEKNESYFQPYQTVPNAAIASKKWSQIHYLKGYFLLMHLAVTVGFERFDCFLKSYLEQYKGQLVTSEMFFDCYSTHFSLSSEIKYDVTRVWLESTGIPKEIAVVDVANNRLVGMVEDELTFWKNCNIANKRCRSRGVKRKQTQYKTRTRLVGCNQIVLLLEKLLLVNEIVPTTMTQLNLCYQFKCRNAEIRHRWCELIIKHGCWNRHDEVKRFIVEDQGMGIYLFGELMIWNREKQMNLARELFDLISNEMDNSTKETVADLVRRS